MLSFGGKDVPVLTALPDWSRGIGAVCRQETLVARALSGREDRRQRRPRGLWSLRFEAATHTARETGYVRAVMLAAKGMPVAVPFWPQAITLSADVAAGAASLTHSDAADLFGYSSGGYALVLAHPMSWEVVQIDTPGDEVTTLAAATGGAWDAGATFVPLFVGHLPRPDTQHKTDAAGRWNVEFEEKFL